MREQALEIRTTDAQFYIDLWRFINDYQPRIEGTVIKILGDNPQQEFDNIRKILGIDEQESSMVTRNPAYDGPMGVMSDYDDCIDLPEPGDVDFVPPGIFIDLWVIEHLMNSHATNMKSGRDTFYTCLKFDESDTNMFFVHRDYKGY